MLSTVAKIMAACKMHTAAMVIVNKRMEFAKEVLNGGCCYVTGYGGAPGHGAVKSLCMGCSCVCIRMCASLCMN